MEEADDGNSGRSRPHSDKPLTAQQTRHSPNAVSMLGHHLQRWPSIETALGECIVFAGCHHTFEKHDKLFILSTKMIPRLPTTA